MISSANRTYELEAAMLEIRLNINSLVAGSYSRPYHFAVFPTDSFLEKNPEVCSNGTDTSPSTMIPSNGFRGDATYQGNRHSNGHYLYSPKQNSLKKTSKTHPSVPAVPSHYHGDSLRVTTSSWREDERVEVTKPQPMHWADLLQSLEQLREARIFFIRLPMSHCTSPRVLFLTWQPIYERKLGTGLPMGRGGFTTKWSLPQEQVYFTRPHTLTQRESCIGTPFDENHNIPKPKGSLASRLLNRNSYQVSSAPNSPRHKPRPMLTLDDLEQHHRVPLNHHPPPYNSLDMSHHLVSSPASNTSLKHSHISPGKGNPLTLNRPYSSHGWERVGRLQVLIATELNHFLRDTGVQTFRAINTTQLRNYLKILLWIQGEENDETTARFLKGDLSTAV